MHAVALIVGLAGCTDEEAGTSFPAADLVLHLGAAFVSGERSPQDGQSLVEGATADEHDWSLAIREATLLVGVPAAGEVRRYTVAEGDFDGGVVAASGDPRERYGAAVDAGEGRVLVGAPDHDIGPDGPGAGLVDRLGGGAVQVTGTVTQGRFGSVVAACGDLDGDGVGEWAATAPWEGDIAGAVYLGAYSAPAVDTSSLRRIAGSAAGHRFGAAVLCSAKLIGDSATMAVGAPFAPGDGNVDAEGEVTLWNLDDIDANKPSWTLHGRAAGEQDTPEYFGAALAACELDGDGLPELVVGAPGTSAGLGAAYVFLGSDLRGGAAFAARYIVRGASSDARLGSALGCGDLDGDGLDELVVGAPGENAADGTRQVGAIYVFRGPLSAWNAQVFAGVDEWAVLREDRAFLEAGKRFVVGDLDGDGLSDLVTLLRQRAR
ncbi:MAG: FG-GAP repeat protein [Deltaproteobacteria bacterium]|nr:FG-GAP repeat protein [Deltaproteobacteria bacterium]